MAKKVNSFICSTCQATYPKWTGKCDSCEQWNTIVENTNINIATSNHKNISKGNLLKFENLADRTEILPRYLTTIEEFDRVCGGGIVSGSAILVGGEPGIGKSTILMQVVAKLSKTLNCIYISGEESIDQIARRAERLGIEDKNLQISTASSINDILYTISKMPETKLLIIDSIQTVYLEEIGSIVGTVSQVKACANELINFCKKNNIILIMIGHVTREGQIAGPKVLEHMVDCVLYFEGEKNNNYRILRAVKNRFGACDEIGIFEMTETGLQEVENPSALFLQDYLSNLSGTAVFCALEGIRPVMVEVQSLINPTVFPTPKRAVVGADSNRLSMITAVLENKAGILFANKDIYLNIAGGLKITEPSLDLAIVASLVSSFLDKPLVKGSVFIGEVSLSGQIRNTSALEKRLNEAQRLGFELAIIPKLNDKQRKMLKNSIKTIEIQNINDIINFIK
jgi:DNA repair protein RadA/Sms